MPPRLFCVVLPVENLGRVTNSGPPPTVTQMAMTLMTLRATNLMSRKLRPMGWLRVSAVFRPRIFPLTAFDRDIGAKKHGKDAGAAGC